MNGAGEAAAGNGDWQCGSCTLINEAEVVECDACGVLRPPVIGARFDDRPVRQREAVERQALQAENQRQSVHEFAEQNWHERLREEAAAEDERWYAEREAAVQREREAERAREAAAEPWHEEELVRENDELARGAVAEREREAAAEQWWREAADRHAQEEAPHAQRDAHAAAVELVREVATQPEQVAAAPRVHRNRVPPCTNMICTRAGIANTHSFNNCRCRGGPNNHNGGGGGRRVRAPCTNNICIAVGTTLTHSFEACGRPGGPRHRPRRGGAHAMNDEPEETVQAEFCNEEDGYGYNDYY